MTLLLIRLCVYNQSLKVGVFVKKINKFVKKPKEGFNVIATANTKGQGSDDGKFIGTNVLNEAFLEKISVTFEQKYPSVVLRKKYLTMRKTFW